MVRLSIQRRMFASRFRSFGLDLLIRATQIAVNYFALLRERTKEGADEFATGKGHNTDQQHH